MTIAEMREMLEESRTEFSKRYGIPLRALENWEAGSRKAPEYVLKLLERAVLEDVKKEQNKNGRKKYTVKV